MDSSNLHLDDPAYYRIRTRGVLDAYALELFRDVWVVSEQNGARPGATTLIGQVTDQAALMGVLEQLYCMGLPILSVEHLEQTTAYQGA